MRLNLFAIGWFHIQIPLLRNIGLKNALLQSLIDFGRLVQLIADSERTPWAASHNVLLRNVCPLLYPQCTASSPDWTVNMRQRLFNTTNDINERVEHKDGQVVEVGQRFRNVPTSAAAWTSCA